MITKRLLTVFLFLFLTGQILNGQSLNDFFSERELSVLSRAQAFIHNAHFQQAESLLVASRQQLSPPSFFFLMQANYFWRYVYTKNDSFLVLTKQYGEDNLNYLKKQDDSKSLRNEFFSGAAHGYLGLAQAMENHLFSAIRHGKKGYNQLKEIYRQYPQFREAELGLGIFEGMVAALPGVLRWMALPLGIKGNMDSARVHLKHAAGKNMITRADAWFYAYGFLRKRNPERSDQILDSLVTHYPDNPLYLSLKGLSLFRHKRYQSALTYFTRSRQKMREPFQNLDVLVESYQARCEFKLKHYRACIDRYLQVKSRYPQKLKKNQLDFLYAYVAKSYRILGNAAKAQQYFARIKNKKIYDRVTEN